MDEFYYHHGNKDQGWIHYNIMRDYLREFKPTLWQWFNETKTPFGGLVGNNFHDGKLPQFVNSASQIDMYILMFPRTMEETAFRLCFGIMSESN